MTTTEESTATTVAYATEPTPRLDWAALAPDVFKAMVRLDAAAGRGLEPALRELVKIRASQINHCAFCLDMHTKDALAAGESVERIVQLSAWEESRHFYTERELAALELTDAVTVLTGGTSQAFGTGGGFVPDEVYERAARQFEEAELAQLIAAISVINAWNRFGVTCRRTPGHYQPGQFR
ncbi:carboxymuconolactone decarboxylase family protein [Streptomyces chartreusis]|uniref:carboxymuconolactone decarboxylase family protein n=2 Tax=Streptomyces TaxID=1883 RepID=UPI00123DCDA2|nr:carboxymuconolactone decarboxylase family protein [Streptomyces chartreusis]QEV68141.1 carboxymuconolactone decarboxylase family protein [Streptomyces chartreusis]GGX33725.1 alkyl hydroperoxide reductase AhpD [Streptomyces chartreusis]